MHCFSPLTPTVFLERAGVAFPSAVAMQGAWGTLSYAGLRGRARKLMTALRERGVVAGDRVAVLSDNAPEMVEAHYGIPAAGAVIVSLNPWLPTEDIRHQLAFSGCRVVLAEHGCVQKHWRAFAEPGAPQHALLFGRSNSEAPAGAESYEEALRGAPERDPLDALVHGEMMPITLNFTSGTTGRAKGVLTSHRGAYLHALGQVMMLGLSRGCGYLWTLPMFHVSGWGHAWACVAAGSRQIMSKLPDENSEDEARFARQFRELDVSHWAGSPRLVRRVAAIPGIRGALRGNTIVTGGAAPTAGLLALMEDAGARVIHQYGLSETSGPFVVCEQQPAWDQESAERRAALRCRQGVAAVHAGTGLRVVDREGRQVASDGRSPGEVQMSGNTVALGYFDNPEATAKAFVDGWFRTGDVAVVHPDGYLEIIDRVKDLIFVETEYGWENISSIEIENVLGGVAGVRDCAVVGIGAAAGDGDRGATVVAFFEVQPGSGLDAGELRAHCRERLPQHKQPVHIFAMAIPKTVTGKVRKDLLVDEARRRVANGNIS